jgi:hypothetical protein
MTWVNQVAASLQAIQSCHFSHSLRRVVVLHRAKIILQAAESDEDKAKRLNGGSDPNVRHRARNMLEAFQRIGAEEGVRGYFKGLHAQIVKTVLSAALMLMIKEKVASSTWLVMMALQRYMVAGENKMKAVTLPPSAVAPIGVVAIALASKAAR